MPKRKELFLNENKTVSGTLYNNEPSKSNFAKVSLKKKALSVIIGSGALTAVLPILAIVLVYVVISALFGWLSPFEYSLAGEEADPNTGITDMHNAETNKEMLDGYTLMTKNYFDVSQAYYYLNYGDWYGGTCSRRNKFCGLFLTEMRTDSTDDTRAVFGGTCKCKDSGRNCCNIIGYVTGYFGSFAAGTSGSGGRVFNSY